MSNNNGPVAYAIIFGFVFLGNCTYSAAQEIRRGLESIAAEIRSE